MASLKRPDFETEGLQFIPPNVQKTALYQPRRGNWKLPGIGFQAGGKVNSFKARHVTPGQLNSSKFLPGAPVTFEFRRQKCYYARKPYRFLTEVREG